MELSMNYVAYLSRAAGTMQESAIRKMGAASAGVPDVISFAPGYPAPETFPWEDFREITSELLGAREATTPSTARLAGSGRCSRPFSAC
jgi:DNA-binding transcriptional MocR family regulator